MGEFVEANMSKFQRLQVQKRVEGRENELDFNPSSLSGLLESTAERAVINGILLPAVSPLGRIDKPAAVSGVDRAGFYSASSMDRRLISCENLRRSVVSGVRLG
jgi:hypothetical protein